MLCDIYTTSTPKGSWRKENVPSKDKQLLKNDPSTSWTYSVSILLFIAVLGWNPQAASQSVKLEVRRISRRGLPDPQCWLEDLHKQLWLVAKPPSGYTVRRAHMFLCPVGCKWEGSATHKRVSSPTGKTFIHDDAWLCELGASKCVYGAKKENPISITSRGLRGLCYKFI